MCFLAIMRTPGGRGDLSSARGGASSKGGLSSLHGKTECVCPRKIEKKADQAKEIKHQTL